MNKPMTTVKDDIYLKARTDGTFAIAYALLRIADELGSMTRQAENHTYVMNRSINLSPLVDVLEGIKNNLADK
jgi:hypothetical protein